MIIIFEHKKFSVTLNPETGLIKLNVNPWYRGQNKDLFVKVESVLKQYIRSPITPLTKQEIAQELNKILK